MHWFFSISISKSMKLLFHIGKPLLQVLISCTASSKTSSWCSLSLGKSWPWLRSNCGTTWRLITLETLQPISEWFVGNASSNTRAPVELSSLHSSILLDLLLLLLLLLTQSSSLSKLLRTIFLTNSTWFILSTSKTAIIISLLLVLESILKPVLESSTTGVQKVSTSTSTTSNCGVSHGVCKIRWRSLFSSGKASHLLVASLIDDCPFVG